MTIFDIQTKLQVSNPRPVRRFLVEEGIYDFNTKTLKVDFNSLPKLYLSWKRKNIEDRRKTGRIGRKKKKV